MALTLACFGRFWENVAHSCVFWLFWLKSASLSRVLAVFGIFDNVLRFGDNVLRSGDNVLKSADNVLTMCLSGNQFVASSFLLVLLKKRRKIHSGWAL